MYNLQNKDEKMYINSMTEGTNIENNMNEKNDEGKTKNEDKKILVNHITGEVQIPGVVRVDQGSRIEDVIKAAGGLTENADISSINLAYLVEDGMKIRIPSINDEEISKKNYIIQGTEGIIENDKDIKNKESKENMININTANQGELERLPGIGTTIAKNIIEYRNKNGNFKEIEEIKDVTGIGENKFEKIKDLIKIK